MMGLSKFGAMDLITVFFMMCRALAHTNYIYIYFIIFLHRHPEDTHTHTYTMILGDQRFEDLFATPKQDENWIYK